MLDTNTVSYLLRQHPAVSRRVRETPMASLCISAITKGELLFGLALRPEARRLHVAVQELLRRIDVLPWDAGIADHYGPVRAALENKGKPLAPLDMLIAAHAVAVDAILVSSDQAFAQLANLRLEDWSADRT